MAAERYTFDTNILFYALDSSTGKKHQTAQALIDAADPERVPLLLQTLAELCNAILKRRPDLMDGVELFLQDSAECFKLVSAEPTDLQEALRAHRDHHLPFWDALLWSMARRSRCAVLLTEDLQDGRRLGGVTFRNPFTMTEPELAPYIL